MPQKTNLNVSPYYEDFDENKNFYKILFRPGYSIQTRELTQLQSILQNQVESFGKYAFKQGEMVIPGEIGLNTKLDFVKLSSVSEVAINDGNDIVYKKYDITQLVGQTVLGLTSGVRGTILATRLATESSADTIYVNYLNSGNSNTETTFRQGETLEVEDGVNTPLLVVGTDGSVLPTSILVTNPDTGEQSSLTSPAMGYGSAVKVEEGIYFVNGYFVRNDESLLVIDEYYNKPSAKVGFTIKEEIITPEEDASLYDNSIGSSNQTAPGAHRLKISLSLKEFALDAVTDKNFIQLVTIFRGVVKKKVSPTNYNLLEQTLARRTFDESGDYVVENFSVDVREYAQKDGNRGIYGVDDLGLYNNLSAADASRKMIASIGPGKAYIKGFEIVNKETKYIELNKARESLTSDNVTLKSRGLPTFSVSNVFGSVPLNKEGSELTAYPEIDLYASFNDGSVGSNGTELSTAHRQTIARRGLKFSPEDGIKTICVQLTSAQYSLTNVTEESLAGTKTGGPNINELHIIKTRTGGSSVVTTTVKCLSFAKVNNFLVNSSAAEVFLELTVLGKKDELEALLTEFDDEDSGDNRVIYLSELDARNGTPFGNVVDYSETITPLIGRVKPSNFFLQERGSGFNQDTDIILSKGRLAEGGSSYNSVFGLSYFDPSFFTRIVLEQEPPSTFRGGKYVFGTQSGAYGVIEETSAGRYSTGNLLFVKTLFGKFLPGETLRDEDANTVTIATENTISHFICQNRGGNYNSASLIVINGVTIDASKIELDISAAGNIKQATIKDRTAFKTQYPQPPSVTIEQPQGSGSPSPAANISAVLFRNTVTTYTPQDVKSVGCSFGSGNANTFTADLVIDNKQFANVKNVTDFTFFGGKGFNFVESTSFSADASELVSQGDIIQFSDEDNNTVKATVQYATKQEGPVKTRIYLDTLLPANVVNSSIVVFKPSVQNASKGSLLFPTGSKQISQISSSTDNSNIKYFFRRDFVTTASSSGGVITFAAQLPFGTQRFTEFNEKNYIITVLDPGDAPDIAKGDIVYIPADAVTISSATDTASGLTSGSLSLELDSNYFGTIPSNGTFPKLKLTATLEVENAKPRLKTIIKNKQIVITSPGDRVIPFRGTQYDSEVVEVLSYSDAINLRYVYEGTVSQPPEIDSAGNLISGTDVTDRFTFDNGQRDTIYDVSRLVLKPGFEQTSGQLVVAFDYFNHSQGDFCTIDSYLHEAGVPEDEIPSFNSVVHGNLELKNVLDFRPKVDSTAIVPGFQDTASLAVTTGKFSAAGAVIAATPAPDTNLEFTFSFSQVQYLDRIDGIFLNKSGEFVVKEGNSSLNPTKPDTINDAVPLFYAYIPAYTKTSKDVRITSVDNRRYTMRDIGQLEKRIERLEYYTDLSILEQQALNMQIKDEIGLDRFKSGFFVDNFEEHRVGNLASRDYRCSIDSQQSVLRPQAKEDSVRLKEVNVREDQRIVSGYQKSGDIVTLPFSSLELLGNSFASKTINPNPFVVLQYVGDASISPSIDQWYDQTVDPIVVDTNTSLFNIFLAKESVVESFSSLFNSFVVNWVGTSNSFTSITSLGEVSSLAATASVNTAKVASSSNISPNNNDIGKGVQSKTVGESKVSTALSFFARSNVIKYEIRRLKPNTKISVFLEGRNISRWVNPDLRFSGIAGSSLSAFNGQVSTDENGNASGIILLPAGAPPKENTTWTGDLDTVEYDNDAEEIRVTTGIQTFRFTSSPTNEEKAEVDTYAEVKYYATGVLPENPSSIVSTKPAFFKANEGVQFVDNNTDNPVRPNPLAQTFKVENFEGGCFVTGLDLFFSKKSKNIPLRVYLTDVDSDRPGKNVIPGTEVALLPNTLLKCYTNGTVKITKGEFVTGATSAASGPILKVIDKNGIDLVSSADGVFTLSNEMVYTLVLDNHNGNTFAQNEDLNIPSVTLANATDGTNLKLTIAKDSGRVSGVKITDPGINYDSALLTIESPQLPGGSVATASVQISGGKAYNVDLALSGFGYTEAPSVVVKGIGNGAGGCVIETEIEIDTPAVRMGIATDSTGITPSTTATKFEFAHPVYLQNDTEYALAVETDSTDYEMWVSKLGEIDVSSSTVITSQPSLGSVYKSQNTENWSEDIFEDLKFTLYRAEFRIDRPCELLLKNESLGYTLLDTNPFATNAESNSNATSLLFKNNNKIINVSHRDNGFEDRGKSFVFYRTAQEIASISASSLNNTLFEVDNSGIDSYTIKSATSASTNAIGGGSSVYATYNRKFETLFPQVRYLINTGTKLETSVKTTNVIPADSNTTNYTSYSQTSYEKTFLNEPHYFTNQKLIASDINETVNNIDSSLTYKMMLSSTKTYLSPVVDLSSASVKTVSNRIQNSKGQEDRFGKRDQILEFFPVYQFTITGNGATTITNDQSIEGQTSKAKGRVVKVDATNNILFVRISTTQFFQKGETLTFGGANSGLTSTSVNSNPLKYSPSISEGVTVVARNVTPASANDADTYVNTISGKVIFWDSENDKLTLRVDKQPISDDFTGAISTSTFYSRNGTTADQAPDIFRIEDYVKYPDQIDDDKLTLRVKGVTYTNGSEYVGEDTSKNGSAAAKYVTKEVFIENPATSIDVRLTANVKDVANISVLYKFKKASSQENFDDIEWEYFNVAGEPDTLELATSENTISSIVEKQSAYQELKYSVSNLQEFTSFAVKIVMKTDDPAFVPKIQDIRAVASF